MDKKVLFTTRAAVTAALYALLTLLGAVFNLSYGAVQFRFAEVLCILPVFTAAAVPGLTVGCFIANILSPVSPLDTVFGTLATFFAAVCSRALKNVKVHSLPFCSLLMPVIFNGLIIGAETAFFVSAESFAAAFAVNSLTVALGETAVMLILGSILYFTVERNERLKRIISGK